MSEVKTIRLAKVAKDINLGIGNIAEFLHSKGFKDVENNPNGKITESQYNILLKEFSSSAKMKEESEQITIFKRKEEEIYEHHTVIPVLAAPIVVAEAPIVEPPVIVEEKITKKEDGERTKHIVEQPKVIGKIDLEPKPKKKVEPKQPETQTTQIVEVEEKKPIKTTTKEIATKTEAIKEVVVEKEIIIEKTAEVKDDVIRATAGQIAGPKILGKIELKSERRPEDIHRDDETKRKDVEIQKQKDAAKDREDKKKRARIATNKVDINKVSTTNVGGGYQGNRPQGQGTGGGYQGNRPQGQGTGGGYQGNRPNNGGTRRPFTPRTTPEKPETVSEKDIQEKIKATMAKMAGDRSKSNKSKYRRDKREDHAVRREGEDVETNVLPVTEFISVSELAGLMNITPTQIIGSCMKLGVFVSINQRLDAEIIELVASEFGFDAQFIDLSDQEEEEEEDVDAPEDMVKRPPIVTIMGHVDHGKTSLLDYIRSANVVAGEMGGITQHIGAYEVTTATGEQITFLDTPGHEAFTAMRARGAKLTDIVVIVIAADDNVMPQTKEAISHAQAAEVPIIIAINKIDKDGANTDNIRNELSQMNILVEEWGGKYQCQEISAKKGLNIDVLLDKIVLQSEMLDLKANPNKPAIGSVIEASLDKGRGYVTTMMVQEGTLNVGDMMAVGPFYGKVKAMFNERGQKILTAGPSAPVQVLGLTGAPTSGDKMKVYVDESEAREIANKRSTIMREQGMRAKKHITLDEIGRRLALGSFKELNLVVKGDVDGSVEALTDSLLKLSTEEVQVNVILKGVGQISESDVLLASASDAIIVAFQVRPSQSARVLAEKEDIEIKMYSIIYDAIDEVKNAIEGLLEPKFEEKIVGNIEIREVFKVNKVGTIAGSYVLDGKVARSNKIRVIRDGIVIHTGELDSLKRYKDDVKDVTKGYECGIKLKGYNDIEVGDIVEAFEQVEVKRKV